MEMFSGVNELARSSLDRLAAQAGTHLIFGPAQERGNRTVIPVGEIRYRFNVGGGGGQGRSEGQSSGGGGGALEAAPIGYIEISADRAEFVPIIDVRRIVTIVFVSLAIIATAWSWAMRGRWSSERR